MPHLTRKEFLRTTLAAGGAALLARGHLNAAPAPAVARRGSPNGDVRVACVGVRQQGGSHMQTFAQMDGVRVVALCDVDSEVLAKRVQQLDQSNIKVKAYTDYRKLLEDSEIDAVVLATPNHWHSLMTIWACEAGKDVYVEKPLSNNVWEGRQVVAAVKRHNRVVQAGAQSRSSRDIKQAIELLRRGDLGKIQWARGLCYKLRESIGRTSGPQPVPPHIDYDLWSGPAPLVPPRRNSSKNGPVHYDWHWFWNYGGGDLANQGIHQMDVARWILGESGMPDSVTSIGGRFGLHDDAETPDTMMSVLAYETAPIIFEVRGLPMKTGMRASDAYRGTRIGVVIQCEGGYLLIGSSGSVVAFDNSNRKLHSFTEGGAADHRRNFIDAVRSRNPAILHGPVEDCHISSALCHIANISYRLGTEKSTADVQAALREDALASETYQRMIEHLEANGVPTQATPSVVGPTLAIAPGTERFISRERYDLGHWANTLLRDACRSPFVVPELA